MFDLTFINTNIGGAMPRTIELDRRRVTFEDTPEMHKAVFDAFIVFCVRNDCWSGESFCQCEWPQVDAMVFIPELMDKILKPKLVEDKGD